MAVWFDGASEIKGSLEQVKTVLQDHGEHYVGVTSLMPGLTSVELVDQGSDSVTIRTNEGLMKRTNITKRYEPDSVVVEFDEEYVAGSRVTATSHFHHQFTPGDTKVLHRIVISNVAASGFLGFLYKRFGSSRMGKAFLTAYITYFKQLSG
jgi:hypothetical protein